MLQLTFKQTNSELLVRAAATVLFSTLIRRDTKLVTISDLAERPQYGFTASAAVEPVGPKFVRITDLQDARINWDTVPYCQCAEPEKYLLRDDDLLFARTGATTGKTHLVRDPAQAVFASYLIRLRPKKSVFAGYLYAFFQSDNYWSQISEEKEGSAQPNVNGEKLAALQIPLVEPKLQHAIAEFLHCVRRRQDGERVELPELPAPLSEQLRVVEQIEQLGAQVHEARILRCQAGEEAKALMASQRRATFGEAPTNDWIPLSDYLSSIENGKSPATEGQPAASNEWGVLKVGAVSFGVFDERENKALPVSYVVPPALEVRSGDFLMSRANTVELVGACAVVRKTRKKLMLSDKIFRFVFREPRTVVPEYMEQALKSPPLREQIERAASGTSPTMKNISKEKVLALRVPPFTLSDQRKIVAELDALQEEVDALKRLQAETATKLDALLPSILDRAVKGEL